MKESTSRWIPALVLALVVGIASGVWYFVAPEVAPQVAPQVAPEVAPQVAPEVAPEVTPEVTPQVAPEVTREQQEDVPSIPQNKLETKQSKVSVPSKKETPKAPPPASPEPAQPQLVLGRDYVSINPEQPTDSPDKIEVVEFFSYGCPHCNDLSPLITLWAAKLPSDVVLKRVPISFNRPQWASLAKLYYTLEITGDLATLDGQVFRALHVEGLNLSTNSNIAEWAVGRGAEAKKFSDAFSSFSVDNKAKRGDQLAASAKIQGVPALMVDGRYLVVGQGTHAELLALTDKVIDKARSERNAKKK